LLAGAAGLAMAVLLVAGCFQPDAAPDPAGLFNDTAIIVYVSQVVEGVEQPVTRLRPGSTSDWLFHYETSASGGGCTDVDIVLRDEAGAELGRIPPPLCFSPELVYLSQILPGVPTASPVP
jgi:hypothetical protein